MQKFLGVLHFIGLYYNDQNLMRCYMWSTQIIIRKHNNNRVMRLRSKKNYSQLQTIRKIVKIKAQGIKFINGISDKYDSTFPSQLKGLVNQQKYEIYMMQMNRKLKQYWPCCFAYYCGYCCIPCTLGFSLCLPRVCVADAQRKINVEVLGNTKLEMRLIKECDDSYFLIQERDFAQFQLNDENITSL